MRTSEEGIALIKKFEGCELSSYQCSAGVLTIGYGHTLGVQDGDTCTQEEAESMLKDDLGVFEEAVDRLVNVDLEQNQFDSLVTMKRIGHIMQQLRTTKLEKLMMQLKIYQR